MNDGLLLMAVLCLLFGTAAALRPYRMARFAEAMDAIGRKPAGPVEPTEARVRFTRGLGALLALGGTAYLVVAAL